MKNVIEDMSISQDRRYEDTFEQSCIMLAKTNKSNLQHLAKLKLTTISHLINIAVEEYMKKYVEEQTNKKIIVI